MKKRVSGDWVSIPYRKYGTDTDVITSLPTNIIGDGTNATVVVNGQSSQASPPSPSSPVPVSGVGEISVNLTNVNSFTNSETTDTGRDYFRAQLRLSDSTNVAQDVMSNGHYKLSIENVGNTTVTFRHSGQTTNILIFTYTATFSTPQTVTVSFDVEGYDPENLNGLVLRNIMLNVGADELPYAPYGQYVIPVTKNGVTTNYALGTVQSTRRIKKVVLTGQENWAINGEGTDKAYFSYSTGDNIQISTTQICSHYSYNTVTESNTNTGIYVTSLGVIRIREDNAETSSLTTFTAFLAQQYATGTPVTVWYVLATEETGIVNEPLMKIGDYADSISASIPTTDGANILDISTTLQPSSVDVTYHGWHSKADKEYTNGSWS